MISRLKKFAPKEGREMKAKIERIELFHKFCFGCDRHNKYDILRQYIIDERLPLDTLWIKRVETNPEWQEEAKNIGLDLPFLRITMRNGTVNNITYEEWVNKQTKKARRPRKKITTKTTSMKVEDVAEKIAENYGETLKKLSKE